MTSTNGAMSPRGAAIARYKARANAEGASAWADVPCAQSIRMHIPKFEYYGSRLRRDRLKGFRIDRVSRHTAYGIRQELLEIHEHGLYVTCYLRQSDGNSEWDSVEVFLFDENACVSEIWAL